MSGNTIAFFTSPPVYSYNDLFSPDYKPDTEEEKVFVKALANLINNNDSVLDNLISRETDKVFLKTDPTTKTEIVLEGLTPAEEDIYSMLHTKYPELFNKLNDIYMGGSDPYAGTGMGPEQVPSASLGLPMVEPVHGGGFRKTYKKKKNKARKRSRGTRKK